MTEHLYIVIDYGLYHPPYADRMLAELWIGVGEPQRAIPHLEYLVEVWPESEVWKNRLNAVKNMSNTH